jgi:arylsulfatase
VIDIVPTILQLAGVTPPTEVNGRVVPTAPGTSLVPAFDSADVSLHETLWWMHEGHRAVRQGDWKLVAAKGDPWELYNVLEDRSEQHNLAQLKPKLVNDLAATWETTAEGIRELYSSE